MKRNNKAATAAIVFFAIMTLVGIGTANAQINLLEQTLQPDSNSLTATTGPNTIGADRLQLSGNLGWSHFDYHDDYFTINPDNSMTEVNKSSVMNAFGLGAGLRYGIGNIFELYLNPSGSMYSLRNRENDSIETQDLKTLGITFGGKLRFYEGGHGWVPSMAIFASLTALTYTRSGDNSTYSDNLYCTPSLGLQFRNRFGGRWLLDYSLGVNIYSGNAQNYKPTGAFDYSVMLRWLPTDRLMLGAGIDDNYGLFEVLWQATPALQVKAQAGVSGGVGLGSGMFYSYANAGINWMIK